MVVAAEHPALFYELLNTEPALARGLTSRWLKTAVLSSEVAADPNPPGPRLSFTITLPPAEQAEELNTLLVGLRAYPDLVVDDELGSVECAAAVGSIWA